MKNFVFKIKINVAEIKIEDSLETLKPKDKKNRKILVNIFNYFFLKLNKKNSENMWQMSSKRKFDNFLTQLHNVNEILKIFEVLRKKLP